MVEADESLALTNYRASAALGVYLAWIRVCDVRMMGLEGEDV